MSRRQYLVVQHAHAADGVSVTVRAPHGRDQHHPLASLEDAARLILATELGEPAARMARRFVEYLQPHWSARTSRMVSLSGARIAAWADALARTA